MKFQPRTNEELAAMGLMPEGKYEFTVFESEDQISKAGSEMIKLTLRVKDSEGTMHIIFDYLLEKMAWKLKHFCECTGLSSKYDSGDLSAIDCLDKTGVCEIIVQEGQQKYDGSKYADKNAVKDYVENKGSMSKDPVPEVTGHPAFDDDIPF